VRGAPDQVHSASRVLSIRWAHSSSDGRAASSWSRQALYRSARPLGPLVALQTGVRSCSSLVDSGLFALHVNRPLENVASGCERASLSGGLAILTTKVNCDQALSAQLTQLTNWKLQVAFALQHWIEEIGGTNLSMLARSNVVQVCRQSLERFWLRLQNESQLQANSKDCMLVQLAFAGHKQITRTALQSIVAKRATRQKGWARTSAVSAPRAPVPRRGTSCHGGPGHR
jgi:hypothetical protein